MTRHDDKVYLEFIMECIAKIEKYSSGTQHVFTEVDEFYDATLRQLQIMAESTQRLSDDCKARAPEIPWHALSGLRNILVHQYLGKIFPDKIQHYIVEDVPALKQSVQRLLKEMKDE